MIKNKQRDLELLEKEFWLNLMKFDDYLGLDMKRPFGNSDIESDILYIIGQEDEGGDDDYWSDKQREYASSLFDELPKYLKKKYYKE